MPELLFHGGRFLEAVMRRARVRHDEIRATMRSHGHGTPEEVEAVILETNGSLSVVGRVRSGSADSLRGVPGVPD